MPEWESDIRKRLARLRIEPTRENEIVEELAQHLADRFEELRAGGATEEEAARAVRLELSEGEMLQQGLRQVERPVNAEPFVWGTRGRNMIADLWQDLVYPRHCQLERRRAG